MRKHRKFPVLILELISAAFAGAAKPHLLQRTVFGKKQRSTSIHDHLKCRTAAVGLFVSCDQILDLMTVKLIRKGHSLRTQLIQRITACRIDHIKGVIRHERVGLPIAENAAVSTQKKFAFPIFIHILISANDIVEVNVFYAAGLANVILFLGRHSRRQIRFLQRKRNRFFRWFLFYPLFPFCQLRIVKRLYDLPSGTV